MPIDFVQVPRERHSNKYCTMIFDHSQNYWLFEFVLSTDLVYYIFCALLTREALTMDIIHYIYYLCFDPARNIA